MVPYFPPALLQGDVNKTHMGERYEKGKSKSKSKDVQIYKWKAESRSDMCTEEVKIKAKHLCEE